MRLRELYTGQNTEFKVKKLLLLSYVLLNMEITEPQPLNLGLHSTKRWRTMPTPPPRAGPTSTYPPPVWGCRGEITELQPLGPTVGTNQCLVLPQSQSRAQPTVTTSRKYL